MTAPHLIDYPYANVDREAADRILAQCKDKPIRRMGPSDYSAGPLVPVSAIGQTQTIGRLKDKADQARKELGERCMAYLREHGACTTAELSRATVNNAKAVACAMRELPSVMSEAVVIGGSRTVLWMMPVLTGHKIGGV